jgi:hypothetical protein
MPVHDVAGSSNKNNNANNTKSKHDKEEASHIPGTNVVRLMRHVIPANAKICSDEAK